MASSLDIKKIQMIHKQAQTGVINASLMTAVKSVQAKNGLKATGLIDSTTLNLYKAKWPYAWGLSAPGGGSPLSSAGGAVDFGPMMTNIIGGVLLYGIFRVLMKVF